MYKTVKGERTLSGAERAVFVESLGMLTDFLSDNDYDVGIEVFDNLQRGQKIAVLLGVSKGLLRRNVPPPPLTAISEAAVAAVFRNLQDRLVEEIQLSVMDHNAGAKTLDAGEWSADVDESGTRSCRNLVLDACRVVTEIDSFPDAANTEEAKWTFLIEALQDQILWDTDWEMALPLDMDPEEGEALKEFMGINDDYFVAVPPDPTDEEVAAMIMQLRYLTPEGRSL